MKSSATKLLLKSTVLLLLMLCLACSGDDTQRIEGTVVEGCDDTTPIANAEVVIHFLEKGLPGFGGVSGRNFTYTTTTDGSGHFIFDLEEKSWNLGDAGTFGAELRVNGRNVMNGITSADSDLGNILLIFLKGSILSALFRLQEFCLMTPSL